MPIEDGLASLPAGELPEAQEVNPGPETPGTLEPVGPPGTVSEAIAQPVGPSLQTLAPVEQAAESSTGESIKTSALIEQAAVSSGGESLKTSAPIEQAAESSKLPSHKTSASIEQAAESSQALLVVKSEPSPEAMDTLFEVPESDEIPAAQPDPSPSKLAFGRVCDPSMADTLVIRSPPSIPSTWDQDSQPPAPLWLTPTPSKPVQQAPEPDELADVEARIALVESLVLTRHCVLYPLYKVPPQRSLLPRKQLAARRMQQPSQPLKAEVGQLRASSKGLPCLESRNR